jgi:hypothetical protein
MDDVPRTIINNVIRLLSEKEKRSDLPIRYAYNREFDSNTTDFEEMSNANRICIAGRLNDDDLKVAVLLAKAVIDNNYRIGDEDDVIHRYYIIHDHEMPEELQERIFEEEPEAYYEVLLGFNSDCYIGNYDLIPEEVMGRWADFPETILELDYLLDIIGIEPDGIVFTQDVLK